MKNMKRIVMLLSMVLIASLASAASPRNGKQYKELTVYRTATPVRHYSERINFIPVTYRHKVYYYYEGRFFHKTSRGYIQLRKVPAGLKARIAPPKPVNTRKVVYTTPVNNAPSSKTIHIVVTR